MYWRTLCQMRCYAILPNFAMHMTEFHCLCAKCYSHLISTVKHRTRQPCDLYSHRNNSSRVLHYGCKSPSDMQKRLYPVPSSFPPFRPTLLLDHRHCTRPPPTTTTDRPPPRVPRTIQKDSIPERKSNDPNPRSVSDRRFGPRHTRHVDCHCRRQKEKSWSGWKSFPVSWGKFR